MIVVIPVTNNKEQTISTVKKLEDSVVDRKHFQIIIADNASDPIYTPTDFSSDKPSADFLKPEPLHLTVMRNNVDVGRIYPLKQVYDLYKSLYPLEIVGLMRFDLGVIEEGWNDKMLVKGWDVEVEGRYMADPQMEQNAYENRQVMLDFDMEYVNQGGYKGLAIYFFRWSFLEKVKDFEKFIPK
jgi:hypothetical protein